MLPLIYNSRCILELIALAAEGVKLQVSTIWLARCLDLLGSLQDLGLFLLYPMIRDKWKS
jgi:hypothetical protein